ncbi:MAG: formate--tetrahydrofolate ligase, partial [Oscillospiraceae bacterium]|nr:formate--tetrahydrofolate ligase [Oscillospiraceae bacterium]
MKTDIEIAQEARLLPVAEIAQKAHIPEDALSLYGKYKAKIDHRLIKKLGDKPNGKLILVT